MITKILSNEFATEELVSVAVHPGHLKTDIGGQAASKEPETAAGQLRSLLDEFPTEKSGHFIDLSEGEIVW